MRIDDAEESNWAAGEFVVGDSVRIHAGADHERTGVIVEDFGEHAGYAVDIGGDRIVDAGRRWAVTTDDGDLVFLDTADLSPEMGK